MLHSESPAAEWTANGAVFSVVAEHLPNTATVPTGQRLPALIARHIGRDYLAALAAGREVLRSPDVFGEGAP